MPFHDDMFDDADDQENFGHWRDWLNLFFPPGFSFGQSNVHWVPNGPLGSSRLASTQELLALKRASRAAPEDYMRLLSAYAIAHNPKPAIVDMGPLPIPMGVDSPNVLAVGRTGSGKTQAVTLPSALHVLRSGWSMLYINVKGKKQTRLLRRLAKSYGRADDFQLISPLKPDRTLATTCLEGCSRLPTANEVAACMVANAAPRARLGEGAWCYNQAQEWLQHAIAAICTDLPPARRNLNELRRVVLAGDYERFAKAHPCFPVLERFADHVRAGNRNTDTVIATISECTVFIDEIPEFLSVNEVSFHKFARHGGCIIVEIDQADIKRLRPIVTLLLGKAISSLQREANSSSRGCVPHKTVIIIDELIASGPVPGLAEALHTCRELGFSFIAGAQALSQLVNIYADEAPAVLDGFQTQIAFGGGLDWGTAEHFSRRTGIGTMALPALQEPVDGNDGVNFTRRDWQLAARPMLLPSEIASPQPHPFLGMPVTVLSGDGKTSPYQAYLTPSHAEGALDRMMDEISQQVVDDDLRSIPLEVPPSPTQSASNTKPNKNSAFGFADTTGWTTAQIQKRISNGCQLLKSDQAPSQANSWWSSYQLALEDHLDLVVRLIEELVQRSATLAEFYEVCQESEVEDMEANLIYLDFVRRRQKVAAKKRHKRLRDERAFRPATEWLPSMDEADMESFSDSDNPELAYRRCGTCRSLVPVNSVECRICGAK